MTTKSTAIQSNSVDTIASSGTLSLGTSSAGTVNIGRSTGTQVSILAPLVNLGGATNIELKNNGVAPTADTQLGGTNSATLLATTPVTGSVIGTITITTAGIYLFTFASYASFSALGTTNYVVLSGTNTVPVRVGISQQTSSSIGFDGSQVVNATASNYLLTLTTTSTFSSLLLGGYFKATRIG
jgi:hypothetical protein